MAGNQTISDLENRCLELEAEVARLKADCDADTVARFLSRIASQLHAPVSSLILTTQTVLDSPLEGPQREQLNAVLESAESVMSIVKQVQDFAKLESGKLELARVSFSLRQSLAETMRPLERLADRKKLKIACRVAEDTPDQLRGDHIRLRQILTNLVENAVRYTDSGMVEIACALEQPTARGVMLHLLVRDSGPGIPEDAWDSIFEPFIKSAHDQSVGTGLGLAVCSRLVELLGGNIWLESTPGGVGSTFHFTVQFAKDIPPEHPDLVDQPVLVVTSNPQHLKVLRSALEKLEMRVSSASSGPDAASQLLQLRNDARRPLIICSLPDNVVAVELIRGRPETRLAPIIALNQDDNDKDLRRLADMRVRCLPQPLKQSALIEALKQATAETDQHDVTASEEPAAPEAAASAHQEVDGGIQILLVEDGIANQKFAVSILERWGHVVTIANNGQECLDRLQEQPDRFQLVLMDVLMPVMDGLQATQAIRQAEQGTGRHMPVVAITAQDSQEDQKNCLASGMDHYLTKPIRRRELQDLIERFVNSE